jgi:hypothetical protein
VEGKNRPERRELGTFDIPSACPLGVNRKLEAYATRIGKLEAYPTRIGKLEAYPTYLSSVF